jgi:two-component system, response regulator PdtaR
MSHVTNSASTGTPLASTQRASRGKSAGDRTAVDVPLSFAPCRVLIADDELMPAMGLSAHVRELGHTVVAVARDGEEALELAKLHKPDLAIFDIEMPRKNGIQAARELFMSARVPSVIVSGHSEDDRVTSIWSNGSNAGVFAYLVKPVTQGDLRVSIGVARQRAATEQAMSGRIDQLEQNLAQRRVVEHAKWVLVQKHQLTEPEAHERLQRLARDQRRPLAEIAKLVAETGQLV